VRRGNGRVQALRMGDWKLVQPAAGKPFERYDLRADVGEKKDVAAANAAVVEQMKRHLAVAHTVPRTFPPEKSPTVNDYAN
jgi:arylsulfatase A-like enzyme